MITCTASPGRIRRTLLAAVLGGLAGGALVASLAPSVGMPAARATFAAVAAAAILLARGTSGVPSRVAIAATIAALGALVERVVPSGVSFAITGFGIGLVVIDEWLHLGPASKLIRASSAGAGALVCAGRTYGACCACRQMDVATTPRATGTNPKHHSVASQVPV